MDIGVTKTIITPTTGLQEGSTIAKRYQILEELGRGGMGVVYKAEDTKLKRTVALKLLPPELTHIQEVKERFMREAQAAAALEHPNICTVYEFDEAEEKTFISMAYVEGQSLRKKIESGPLELDEALRIATQIAEGLQEAHKRGIVHRDIKSANIMIDQRDQAKIMDFGLARMTGGTLLTQEGTAMGTIAYMSPEQAQGEEVDHRTDIWSFGVVLYEMFGGQLPFMGEQDQAVVYSILNKKPKPLAELRSEIPVSIGQVIDKALEKNQDERYQQMGDLLDDLKSISAGIIPEEIKIRLRKAKLRRRKRTILYAGAVGLVIVMAVLALTLFTRPAEAIESIAVLPLENLTGDAEQQYVVDSVTDELIGQLGQISGLKRVISRTSVMRYKETDKSLSEIARELKVDAIVEGTVYQVGDSIRVRFQLTDALPEEQNLWGETYERPMSDVLMMYSEVAKVIALELKIGLTQQEETRFAAARQVNPEAYDAYLKGSFQVVKLTRAGLDAAQSYFELALEKDPAYAPALAGIAFVWAGRGQMGMLPAREARERQREAAIRALALDESCVEARFTMACVMAWGDWDWKGAEKEFLRIIKLDPQYVMAHAYYAHLLAIIGRYDEAVTHMELALELDPYNALFHSLYAGVLNFLARYTEAVAAARTALTLQPDLPTGRSQLRLALSALGRHDELLAIQRESASNDPELLAALEKGFAKAGFKGAQKSVANVQAARYGKPEGVRAITIAGTYFDAGDMDLALHWFEKAFEAHEPNLPYLGRPYWDPLRSDPRFQELLRKMNLPVDERE
jgi:serine/threonine-protein kinase